MDESTRQMWVKQKKQNKKNNKKQKNKKKKQKKKKRSNKMVGPTGFNLFSFAPLLQC